MAEVEDDMNVNRKLSVYKHIKKKAANDAQLLMWVFLDEPEVITKEANRSLFFFLGIVSR